MTTTVKKNAKKRSHGILRHLPPSADLVKISGREYVIAPLDEFEEWEEDRALAALVSERLEEDAPFISMEELEKHLDQKNKDRGK